MGLHMPRVAGCKMKTASFEARWSKVQGNFGDTLTLRFINWDNEVMGTVQFRLQK